MAQYSFSSKAGRITTIKKLNEKMIQIQQQNQPALCGKDWDQEDHEQDDDRHYISRNERNNRHIHHCYYTGGTRHCSATMCQPMVYLTCGINQDFNLHKNLHTSI